MRLIARGIKHAYGHTPVLANVDLEIDHGESLAVTGPSGVGKSTLAAILGGLLVPDAGTVHLVDRNETHISVRHAGRDIGWVFQTTNAFGNRTARDNLVSYLRLRGWPRDEAALRAAEVATIVGIATTLDRRVRTLSGGERQRLGVARALADHPPVLLADEPTGQLDTVATAAVAAALVAGRPTDGILVVVTHDPEVASRCDRQLHLRTS